jgi:coniferyl-aldehyde dehydrogenase
MNANDMPVPLQALFEAQRAAYSAAPYSPWEARAHRLRRLLDLIRDNEAAIKQSIDQDFGGRPAIETDVAEIWPSLAEVKGALRHGRRWMKPRRAGVGKWFLPASGRVMPQPLGVVGILVPWNYPLYLAIGPMAAALAAGNRVMVKMSEASPAFASCFQALCAKAFAEDEVAVVTGGPDVAAQFSALPFDHLLFTGSTTIGRHVMGAAARNLTPVTLELGGKSPTVISPEYPMEHAVQRILAGKLMNAGQTCIAPDYVLLPRSRIDEFVTQARRQTRAMVPGGLADPGYCSVVNDRQYQRLTRDLDEAVRRGSRVEVLFDDAARDDARHRLAPTLLIDPPADSGVMREEIFGPLLPLVGYGHIDEALEYIKARPRPLALYWFDHDRRRVARAMEETHAGGVCVNETILHVAQESMPFGGVGPSGMGHYHGQWGFATFSKMKPIFMQSRLNGMKLFLPPYSPLARRMLDLMKRF